jgi:PAS domain S-box-containing protein
MRPYYSYQCNKTPRALVPLIVIVSIIALSSCSPAHSGKTPPRAVKSVLDLRGWDLSKDGPIILRGEVEFYWEKLLKPADFPAVAEEGKPDYIQIPGAWGGQILRGKKLPGPGYATYRLKILLNRSDDVLAVKLRDMSAAYAVYINGKKVKSSGVLGTSLETTTPQYGREVVSFPFPGKNELEMVVSASNFPNKMDASEIYFGRDEEIQRMRENKVAGNVFLFGSILMMGLYNLSIFFFRKKYRSPLYFGVYCLLISYFTIFTEESYLFALIPGANWDISYRLMLLSVYFSASFFAMFLNSLFPDEFIKPAVRVLQALSLGFSAVVLTSPLGVYQYTLKPFEGVLILACLYTIYVLVIAAVRGRDGALVFLAGFAFLFVTVVNDVLYDNLVISTGNFIPVGLFVFIFSQTVILSVRSSRSFIAVETLSVELQEKNMELSHTWSYLINVFNSLPSMLISVNKDGIITQWNTAAEQYSGIPASKAVSNKLWEIVPYLGGYRDDIMKVIETRKPDERHRENIEHTGEKKYINISMTPLVYDGVDGAVIRVDDVTELEKKDIHLRQAQKMETVGALAGGIAHDFNNVLGGIIGAVSLMKYDLGKPEMNIPRVQEMIKILEDSSGRAADMVQHLLAISRKQEISLAPVDLNDAVRRVLKICKNTFDKAIDIRAAYHAGPAMVRADATQVEQVVLNICINASHAMTIMKGEGESTGGMLTVSIDRQRADRYFCEMHPEASPGYYWMISHRDNGVGMDSKTISKIFDPFFSTKQTGKGTGLGLAMVYNIVQQHGGFIDVYSEPGIGSTFNVFLPELEEGAGQPVAEPEECIETGVGTLLVIDDEEAIRLTTTHMLEECGYRVITASNGEEGIALFRGRHQEIRAVMLDVAMPRKSGIESFEEIKAIDPAVKILLMSGFKQDERVQKLLARGVDDFIQKPYSLVELSKKLKKILG